MNGSPDPAQQKIDESLLACWRKDPQATVAALVRTVDAAEPHRSQAEASGLVVRRVLRLVPTLAVEGRVADVVALADQAWVKTISLDRQMHTMQTGRQTGGCACG